MKKHYKRLDFSKLQNAFEELINGHPINDENFIILQRFLLDCHSIISERKKLAMKQTDL